MHPSIPVTKECRRISTHTHLVRDGHVQGLCQNERLTNASCFGAESSRLGVDATIMFDNASLLMQEKIGFVAIQPQFPCLGSKVESCYSSAISMRGVEKSV